jgi:hypothetical protein
VSEAPPLVTPGAPSPPEGLFEPLHALSAKVVEREVRDQANARFMPSDHAAAPTNEHPAFTHLENDSFRNGRRRTDHSERSSHGRENLPPLESEETLRRSASRTSFATATNHSGRACCSEATTPPQERRNNVPENLVELLVLDEWCHPDVVNDERPSSSTTFQELADVLVHGDVSRYTAAQAANTHWSNWPDGGSR